MKTDELIRALRDWAAKMAMPGRRSLVNEAADRLEELDERVAIMEEGNQVTIAPGANIDLKAILDNLGNTASGPIEEGLDDG